MTWICPECANRYPDSGIGVPEQADADRKTGCKLCTDDDPVDAFEDPKKATVYEHASPGPPVDDEGNPLERERKTDTKGTPRLTGSAYESIELPDPPVLTGEKIEKIRNATEAIKAAQRKVAADLFGSTDDPENDPEVREPEDLPTECERRGCTDSADAGVFFDDPPELVGYCDECADEKVNEKPEKYHSAVLL